MARVKRLALEPPLLTGASRNIESVVLFVVQMEQIQLLETKIHNMHVSLRLLQDQNQELRQAKESNEYEKLIQFRFVSTSSPTLLVDLKAKTISLRTLRPYFSKIANIMTYLF